MSFIMMLNALIILAARYAHELKAYSILQMSMVYISFIFLFIVLYFFKLKRQEGM